MYKLSVPIMIDTCIKEEERQKYVEQCLASKVERVFLAFVPKDATVRDEVVENIKVMAELLRKNDIEPAVWVGETIGHGGAMLDAEDESVQIENPHSVVTITGKLIKGTYCPLNEDFTDSIAGCVQKIAQAGIKTILLDDDFRMSQRGDGFCCCCNKHLALMSEKCGEKVTRNLLREKAFKGGKNKYRDAWIDSQAQGLREMAEKIRKAVDIVDDTVRIAICSAWGPWDIDGIDALELGMILAGKTKPLVRTLGAPYWVNVGTSLSAVIETERMFASFCKKEKIEIMSESDPYPRPRYNTPASYLEVFDATLRAVGQHDGILKYMFDYHSSANYETGYIERHIRDLPLLEKISKIFEFGKEEGVRVWVYPHKARTTEYPDDSFVFNWFESQMPYVSGKLLALCSIPSVYENEGICSLIFGENIRQVKSEAYQNGAILDGWSAKILQENGVDVGLEKVISFDKKAIDKEFFVSCNEKVLLKNGNCRLLDAEYKKGVTQESFCEIDGKEYTMSYRYKNAQGQRFFVLNFSVEEQEENISLLNSYARQDSLINAIEWIAGKKLPAKSLKHPQLYVVCKRKENSLAVGLFNLFADSVMNPRIQLDKHYSSVNYLGTNGYMKDDEIILTEEIPAFGFVAFEVFE